MATWQPLGSVIATNEWQFFPALAEAGSLFRVTQNWSHEPHGKAYIAQVYDSTQFYGIRKLYPSPNAFLIELPIPQDYRIVGITSRSIAIKLWFWSRTHADWQFTVEQFY